MLVLLCCVRVFWSFGLGGCSRTVQVCRSPSFPLCDAVIPGAARAAKGAKKEGTVGRKGRERDGGKLLLLLGFVGVGEIAFKSLRNRGRQELEENTRRKLAPTDRTHPRNCQSLDYMHTNSVHYTHKLIT